ncbi:MAG TPA: hypothetical protein VKJ65_14485, partial [Phycisphaerae bacterium]|nr:hypothetical protein [Phycisphaerae bacterium]
MLRPVFHRATSMPLFLIAVVAIALCYGCSSNKDASQGKASFKFQSAVAVSNPSTGVFAPQKHSPLEVRAHFAAVVAAHNKVMDEWATQQQNEIKRSGIQRLLTDNLLKLNDSQTKKQDQDRLPGKKDNNAQEKIVIPNPQLTFCQNGLFLFSAKISDYPESWEGFLPVNVAAPGARMVLLGCHFGAAAGKITMKLTAAGQQFNLPVYVDGAGWSDNLIQVTVPDGISGVIDQPAQIQLTTSTNQISDSIDVPFIATRDSQRFDSDTYRNLVSVDPECPRATTDDSCGGAPVGDSRWPGGRTIVAEHYKSCCRSAKGIDTFYFKLSNGWTLPMLDPFFGSSAEYQYDAGDDVDF